MHASRSHDDPAAASDGEGRRDDPSRHPELLDRPSDATATVAVGEVTFGEGYGDGSGGEADAASVRGSDGSSDGDDTPALPPRHPWATPPAEAMIDVARWARVLALSAFAVRLVAVGADPAGPLLLAATGALLLYQAAFLAYYTEAAVEAGVVLWATHEGLDTLESKGRAGIAVFVDLLLAAVLVVGFL